MRQRRNMMTSFQGAAKSSSAEKVSHKGTKSTEATKETGKSGKSERAGKVTHTGSKAKGSVGTKEASEATKELPTKMKELPTASSTTKVEPKEKTVGYSNANHPVYLVHSHLSVAEIRNVLTDLQAGVIGSLKIDYDRSGHETSRTIVVAEPSVYDAAVAAGLGRKSRKLDFAITPYELREHNKPYTNCIYSFFIPFPKTFDLSAQEAKRQVEAMFSDLVDFDLLGENDFNIKVPLKTRDDNGEAMGLIFVTFGRNVSNEIIELTKVAIDHSTWSSGDSFSTWEDLRCFWSREPKSRSSGKGNKAKVSKAVKLEPLPDIKPISGPVVRTFTNGKAIEKQFVMKPIVPPVVASDSLVDVQDVLA
jgi:hypothetical protein